MQLEDYFDFLAPNDIRIKGSRIGIETVLYDFIFRSMTPEEIDQRYWSINLEQVYATILYYLHNKEEVHQYMTDWIEHGRRMRAKQEENPDPVILRLRALRAKYGKDVARVLAQQRATALAEPMPHYRTDCDE
jgi:uncharacterized protein (DUF433 family)